MKKMYLLFFFIFLVHNTAYGMRNEITSAKQKKFCKIAYSAACALFAVTYLITTADVTEPSNKQLHLANHSNDLRMFAIPCITVVYMAMCAGLYHVIFNKLWDKPTMQFKTKSTRIRTRPKDHYKKRKISKRLVSSQY